MKSDGTSGHAPGTLSFNSYPVSPLPTSQSPQDGFLPCPLAYPSTHGSLPPKWQLGHISRGRPASAMTLCPQERVGVMLVPCCSWRRGKVTAGPNPGDT